MSDRLIRKNTKIKRAKKPARALGLEPKTIYHSKKWDRAMAILSAPKVTAASKRPKEKH